jgi:hypothetical protein
MSAIILHQGSRHGRHHLFTRIFLTGFLALLCGAPHPARAAQSGEAPRQVTPTTHTTAQQATQDGWRPLFDGKTLAGWHGLGDNATPKLFRVESGIMHKLPGTPDETDLITDRSFDNFELEFEWKIKAGGNGGVKYNVSEKLSASNPPGNHSALGFEYQILDDAAQPADFPGKKKCGALYELVAPEAGKTHVKPLGEWNHSRILYDGNHIVHWLNGEKILEADLGSPVIKEALAKSKWRGYPWFGERRKGQIVIQNYQDEAWYRNIRIRELPTR